jgi:hypothetical protein
MPAARAIAPASGHGAQGERFAAGASGGSW